MKTRISIPLSLALLAFVGLGACAAADGPPQEAANGELPADHPPVDAAAAPSQASAQDREVAVVKETMESGGYTYALVELNDEEVWLAGPATELTVGQYVAVSGGMVMENFESASLGRTFETIYFVETFFPLTAEEVEAMKAGKMAGMESSGTVLQSLTAAGYTYAEVETEDGVVWLAGPATSVDDGETLAWPGGMLMQNFESRSLDRTFEEIYFVDRLVVVR
jgi:hypothetical protein